MKAIVYILKFKGPRTYYVGSTNNLDRRLSEHRRGHTQTTRRFGAFTLVFAQELDTLDHARRIEKQIKSWKRRDYIEKVINQGYIKIAGR